MTAPSYSKLFWGLFLILFDFNIAHFDILPDFLGYFLIVWGLSKTHSSFSEARTLALLLGLASIPMALVGEINVLEGFEATNNLKFIFVVSIILRLLHVLFIYFLLNSFRALFKTNINLQTKIRKILFAYLIIEFIQLVFLPFGLNIQEQTYLVIITILILASLLMNILILILIRAMKKQKLDMY